MINNKVIYQIDAFTDELYKGNPAGVMIVDESFESEMMQRIAAEMNLSETAFIIPFDSFFQIRYFTPIKEVPLCGHATLASAHVIYEIGLRQDNENIIFHAQDTTLTVTKEGDSLSMIFPQYPVNQIGIITDFKELVGFTPIEMYSSLYNWIIAIAKTEKEILDAKPKFELLNSSGLGHLMITATSSTNQADFVVRCFAPMMGVNEDPVTGSAHCALTPLWSTKLGKTEMKSIQLSKRTGKLTVQKLNDKVKIQGKSITVFKAHLR
jgi:PhzF family phenazine biosynthesis protein